MTTFADLVADVYTLTSRPDLVNETKLAVRAATLKAHGSDYYYKDLRETGLQFDFEVAQQSLEYKTLLPRWRALKYLRTYKFNSQTELGCAGPFLQILTPGEVLDSYSSAKENVCYVAGLELQIRTLAATKFFLLGYYIYPDVTELTYDSWIANDNPMAIIYEAAATVFKTIGFDEQTAIYKQLVADEYVELKLTNIVANGY